MERTWRITGGVLLAVLIGVAGCSSGNTTWQNSGSGGGGGTTSGNGKVTATITSPASNATNVPASTEIVFTAKGAKSTSVGLTAAGGDSVSGKPREDGSSWVPDKRLAYGTKYTAKVAATDSGGKTETTTTSFTTMAKPAKTVSLHSWIGDNQVLGVGAPVVLTFGASIPKDQRAAVQKRLFMESTPAQEGSWYWFSPTEVHYRPKVYWQTGTKLSLRALFGGLPLGNGAYGNSDITVDASVSPSSLVITADDKTKKVTVTKDGKPIKTMAASFGKASTPSSSGSMVVMTRATSEIFDSTSSGTPANAPGGYRETVYYPLRLTWGGQYIHAAPWSVGSQGRYDVSHGCTNISMNDAKWLYGQVHVGDPVIVKNTTRSLKWGDGWTDWNVSWDDYLKGSAL
jgi:lipoprotein-anchoring transpeptidase ErfK/SrfK